MSEEIFRTSNTALAAYLIAEGYGNPDLDPEGRKTFFVFNNADPKIKTAISLWGTSQAETNAVMFFNAYQNLLRRVREGF